MKECAPFCTEAEQCQGVRVTKQVNGDDGAGFMYVVRRRYPSTISQDRGF